MYVKNQQQQNVTIMKVYLVWECDGWSKSYILSIYKDKLNAIEHVDVLLQSRRYSFNLDTEKHIEVVDQGKNIYYRERGLDAIELYCIEERDLH